MKTLASKRLAFLLIWLASALTLSLTAIILSEHVGWNIDFISGQKVHGPDDAYRYFLYRHASQFTLIYLWDFILPVSAFIGSIITFLTTDTLTSRLFLVFINGFFLSLLYITLYELSIKKCIALIVFISILVMPAVAFTLTSFLGESFIISAISLALYFRASNKTIRESSIISLLPLIRPEGIFIVIFSAIERARSRYWKEVAIMLLPGFIYFMAVMLTSRDITIFTDWRSAYRASLGNTEQANIHNPLFVFSDINLFWMIPGLIGAWLSRSRFGPYFYGFTGYLVFLVTYILLGKANSEPRYLLLGIPVMALGIIYTSNFLFLHYRKFFPMTLIVLLLSFATLENMLQLDDLRNKFGDRRWPIKETRIDTFKFDFVRSDAYRQGPLLSERINQLISKDPEIETVIIYDSSFFYFLDVDPLNAHVDFYWSPLSLHWHQLYNNGAIFLMGPYPQRYRHVFLKSYVDDSNTQEQKALFVTDETENMKKQTFETYGPYRLFVVHYEAIK